ncbi:LacI family DNA-binding transcriptional regulator [Martelella mediterranea]|uniref:LacI family transcriptional regulator n=1 Tax=Martelella mediterranea TaxID=293089 RepID=A0A4R3NKA7_9HYPH|nr:LacI family DNA-binding transcriptional regulator [Martelella mediterranea]TCT35218.1 LacI family transcriptional regulator [Martelella mediterranea]
MSDEASQQARPATADDVARLAGVSRSAVSRTFTKGASVSPATRDKVLEAAATLGYRVNFLARSLSMQRTNLVAMVVSDMDHSLRALLVDRLARNLVAHDFRPFLLPWSTGDEVGRLTDMMLHYNVSGAIVTSDTPPKAIAAECARHNVPLVLVEKAPIGGRVGSVGHDHEKAGRLAAEELYRSGCRRIAYAAQHRPSHSIGERRRAFEQTAAELGITISHRFYGARQNYDGGLEAAEAFWAVSPSVDGFYCANDFLALGFMDGLRRRENIRFPDDFSLVASDDIPEASWSSYDITTVRQNPDHVAEATLEALITCMKPDGSVPETQKIDVELVRRSTTKT